MLKFKAEASSKHPQAEVPSLISYEKLCAFKDEPAFSLTATEYEAICSAINDYVLQGGSLIAGKISRKNHPIKYSVNIADGNFTISYRLNRINEVDSLMFKPADGSAPKLDIHKKPVIYDIGINLTLGEACFIKEYMDTSINAQAPIAYREYQIQTLKTEKNNLDLFKKPCLFWSRNNKYYLQTQYLGKYDFFEWMANNQGSHEEAIDIFIEIVNQVHKLHQSGFLHRDAKIENFMISKKGDDIQVHMVDFASVCKIEDAAKTKEILSSENIRNQTWLREFLAGRQTYSCQTDVYALNMALKDVAEYIADDNPLKTVTELSKTISQFTQKDINACYTIPQLLEQAKLLKQAICQPEDPQAKSTSLSLL